MVAQVARRRTREISIRIALGAGAAGIQWLVVRHALTLTALGTGIGVAVALEATHLMRSLLYHVAPSDLGTFVLVPLMFLVTGGAASWWPAARASQADPTEVLRAE